MTWEAALIVLALFLAGLYVGYRIGRKSTAPKHRKPKAPDSKTGK